MNLKNLHLSPTMLLVDGLPLNHHYVRIFYQEFMHLMHLRYVITVPRPFCREYYLEYTKEGLDWYKATFEKLLAEKRVLEQQTATPAENTTATRAINNLPNGIVRFRELKPGAKFQLIVGRGPHRLRFKKVNDAEEDNAVTDAETPEPCSFPEDQPVIPASKGIV